MTKAEVLAPIQQHETVVEHIELAVGEVLHAVNVTRFVHVIEHINKVDLGESNLNIVLSKKVSIRVVSRFRFRAAKINRNSAKLSKIAELRTMSEKMCKCSRNPGRTVIPNLHF